MILSKDILYRIRRKYDGMFSRGGHPPRFGKTGHVFNGSGPLKNHLRAMMRDYHGNDTDKYVKDFYSDCEVVAVAIVVKSEGTAPKLPDPVPVLDVVAEMQKADECENQCRAKQVAHNLYEAFKARGMIKS